MSDPYFQTLFAERIGGAMYGKTNQIYKFEKIKRAKRKALAEHPEQQLLDFGIGENDDVAAASVRHVMSEEIHRPENRGYADNGILAFKQAAARYMAREFAVSLDPVTEINHCIGSKSALAMLPAVFINPADITLMTVPGYPVAGTHTKFYGGDVHRLPLLAENNFFPDLDHIPQEILQRAKLLVLNYPNSPTGQVATPEFYQRVIAFAKANQIVVIQDAAHVMLTFSGKPFSFLEVPGAREVGVEIHSLSKGWNMIGWRMGFVCGNAQIVRAFADVKDNFDSGQFIATQKAATVALDDAQIPQLLRSKYQRRLQKLALALNDCGFAAKVPGGSYFMYVPCPKGIHGGPAFASAEAACEYLITQRLICTVPWDDAGAFLRFSVTYEAANEAEEDKLMAETRRRFGQDRYIF